MTFRSFFPLLHPPVSPALPAPLWRAAMLGPCLLGISAGVQLLLAGLMFFGPGHATDAELQLLTKSGQGLYQPEHDLPLYVGGCAVSVLFALALVWLWQRRPGRALPLAGSHLLLALGSAGLFFAVLLLGREVTDEVTPNPSWLVACCLAIPVGALGAAMLGLVPPAGELMGLFERLARLPEPAAPEASRPWWRLADFALPILIVLIIYIPWPLELAGAIHPKDEFHHWDFFTMAPAVGYLHGGALGTEVFAQYGVGWPTFHALLASCWDLTYAHLLQVSLIYGCLYFVGLYVLLRLLVGHPGWAAGGLLLALTLHLFEGGAAESLIWQFPSSTMLRHPLDVWFFIAITLSLQTQRRIWSVLAGVAVGLAIFFETDTGLYLTLTFAGYLKFTLFTADPAARRRAWRQGALAALALGATALATLAVASRGTLWQGAFWRGWLESMLKYGGGIGMLPFAGLPNFSILLFAAIVSVYFFAVTRAALSAACGDRPGRQSVIGCLSFYGLMTMLIFVGRSHPYNIYHASIPFSVTVTYFAALLHRRFGLWLAETRPSLPVWFRPTPLACFLTLLAILFSQDSFQRYPNLIMGPQSLIQKDQVSLVRVGVGGLPANRGDFARLFDPLTRKMGQAAAGHGRIAIFDHSDTIYYLAAHARPWFRYSPLLPFLLTKAQVEEVKQKLVTDPPDYVFLSDSEQRSTLYNEKDVREALLQVLHEHYVRQEDWDFFQVWRPAKSVPPTSPL